MTNNKQTGDGAVSDTAPFSIENFIARLSATEGGQALLASLARSVAPPYPAPELLAPAALAAGLAMATGPWGRAPVAPGLAAGGGAALPWLGDFAAALADDPLGVGEWAATSGLATIRSVADGAGLPGLAPVAQDPVLGAAAAGAGRFDPMAYSAVAAPYPAAIRSVDNSLGFDPLALLRPDMAGGEGEPGPSFDAPGLPMGLAHAVAPVPPFLPAGLSPAGREGAAPWHAGGRSPETLLALLMPEVAGRRAAASEGAGGWMPGVAPHDPAAAPAAAGAGLGPLVGLGGGLAAVLADPVLSAAARLTALRSAAPGSAAPDSAAPGLAALGVPASVLEAGRARSLPLPGYPGRAAAGPPGGADILPADTAQSLRGLWAPPGSPDAPADGAHEDALSSMEAFLPAAASPVSSAFGPGAVLGSAFPRPAPGSRVPYPPLLPPSVAAAGLDALGLGAAWGAPLMAGPGGPAFAPDPAPAWLPPGLLAGPPPMPAAPVPPSPMPGLPLGAPSQHRGGAQEGAAPAGGSAASGAPSTHRVHMVLNHRPMRRAVLGYIDRECSGPATGASRPDPGLRLRPGGF